MHSSTRNKLIEGQIVYKANCRPRSEIGNRWKILCTAGRFGGNFYFFSFSATTSSRGR